MGSGRIKTAKHVYPPNQLPTACMMILFRREESREQAAQYSHAAVGMYFKESKQCHNLPQLM